jgi:hypothetical protein
MIENKNTAHRTFKLSKLLKSTSFWLALFFGPGIFILATIPDIRVGNWLLIPYAVIISIIIASNFFANKVQNKNRISTHWTSKPGRFFKSTTFWTAVILNFITLIFSIPISCLFGTDGSRYCFPIDCYVYPPSNTTYIHTDSIFAISYWYLLSWIAWLTFLLITINTLTGKNKLSLLTKGVLPIILNNVYLIWGIWLCLLSIVIAPFFTFVQSIAQAIPQTFRGLYLAIFGLLPAASFGILHLVFMLLITMIAYGNLFHWMAKRAKEQFHLEISPAHGKITGLIIGAIIGLAGMWVSLSVTEISNPINSNEVSLSFGIMSYKLITLQSIAILISLMYMSKFRKLRPQEPDNNIVKSSAIAKDKTDEKLKAISTAQEAETISLDQSIKIERPQE